MRDATVLFGRRRSRRSPPPAGRYDLLVTVLTATELAVGLFLAALVATAWLPPADSEDLVAAGAILLVGGVLLASRRRTTGPEPVDARLPRTVQRLGAAALLGAGTLALVSSAERVRPLAAACAAALVVVTMLKLVRLHALFCFESGRHALPLVRTSHLLRGRLHPLVALRVVSGVLGGIVLPAVNTAKGGIPLLAMLALELCLVGEGTEHALVLRACSAPAAPPAP